MNWSNFFVAMAIRARAAQRYRRSVLTLEVLEQREAPAVLQVNSLLDDTISGNSLVTLREAMTAANNNTTTDLGETGSGADTIRLHSSITSFPAATVLSDPAFPLPTISQGLTIEDRLNDGNTVGDWVIQRGPAAGLYRIFTVGLGVTAEFSEIVAELGLAEQGGGINNAGNLTLNGCEIRDNVATSSAVPPQIRGGGIHNTGTLSIVNSTIINNEAISPVTVTLPPPTVGGAGIYNAGTMTVSGSLIKDNDVRSVSTSTVAIRLLGGGIFNNVGATLTISNQTVVEGNEVFGNNAGEYGGAGMYSEGIVTVTSSSFNGNIICDDFKACTGLPQFDASVIFRGGAIFIAYSGTTPTRLDLDYSTIDSNKVFARDPGAGSQRAHGGAIQANCYGPGICLDIDSSTISRNLAKATGRLEGMDQSAVHGAAISMGSNVEEPAEPPASPQVTIINSTIAENDAITDVSGFGCTLPQERCRTAGAAIWYKEISVRITWTTISNNDAVSPIGTSLGGGIYVSGNPVYGPLILQSTIISPNLADGIHQSFYSDNGDFVISSSGTNIFDDLPPGANLILGDQIYVLDPELQPLLNYGGPTQTMRPLVGSPAINMGAPPGVVVDQRGFGRPVGSSTDVGAVECQPGFYDCVGEGDGPGGGGDDGDGDKIPPPPGDNGAHGIGGFGGAVFQSASVGDALIASQLAARATTPEVQQLPAETTAFFVDRARLVETDVDLPDTMFVELTLDI